MKEVREIKKAKSKLKSLTREAKDLKDNMRMWQRMYSQKINEIQTLNQKIEHMSKGKLKVTEHAMLRYIERVLGIDLNEVENSILGELNLESVEKLGNGTYPVRDFSVVVKENFIVTVIRENAD